jgi:predicted nucleotidyltransferase
MADTGKSPLAIDSLVRDALARCSNVSLAIIFGSVAAGRPRADSDLDIAVGADKPISMPERIAIIQTLAEVTGRPIDLIDLTTVTEPLLGQILKHGRRVLGSDTSYGKLISRHLIDQADFMPLINRMLAERRMAWIGK